MTLTKAPPKKKALRIFWVNPRWKPTRARSGSGACHGATPMTSVAASPSANPWESQVEPPVPSLRNTSVESSLVIFPCVEERMKRYFVKFTGEHMRTIHIFRHWFILAFFDIDIYDQDTFPNTWYRCTLHSGRLTWRHFKMFQPCCWDPNKSLQNIIYSKYCKLCYSDIVPKLHSNWQNLWQDNVKLQTHGICLKKRHADAKVLKEDTQPAAISWVIVGLFGQKAAWAWSSTSQSLMRKHGCCGWCTRQNWGMMTSMTCYISIYDLRMWMIWDELKTMILGVAPESRKCQCRQVYFSSHRPPVRAAPPPQMPSVPKTDAIWSVESCKFSCDHLSTCMKQDLWYGDTCCIQINAESNRYRYSGYSRYQCWVNASEPDPQSCYGRIPTVAA